MTKTNTRNRIVSILLALVMLLTMVPITGVTALAATYNDVKVNGVSLGDGKYLASNSATDSNYSNTEPSSYVAWYKDGTLTLNGYKGTGIVLQGAPAADLIIKLIGDNTITTTTNEVGIQGNRAAGSITITADSGSNGKLTIDVTNSTRPVFGINGYENSVTISGSADVKITAVATATNQESYGIKSDKDVSILENASVSITCKTPNSTSRSDSCNGIFSKTGVTINTGGTIQIDVSDAGDEACSYGIYSMGTLTLTKVGGMTVKWRDKTYGMPLLPSSVSFDSDAYVTSVDKTNCIATYKPKSTAPAITTGNAKVTAPVAGQTPSFTATSDEPEKYSVELLKWIDVENSQDITPVDLNDPASVYYNYTFKGGKEYTAVVRFTAVGDNTLSTSNSFTINGETTYWTGNGLKRCHIFTATGGVSVATYDLTTSVNGGHGTISAGENGITEGTSKIITFTPDSGYEIDKVMVNGTETTVTGNTLTVTMDGNKNVVVTYKAIEYTITVTGGKATIGAGSEISKTAQGTIVTLTANAAPTDMVFDKWEVISGSITLADANSATTTFTMPAGAVSVKATYTTYITVNLAAGEGSGTMEPIIIKNTYGYFSLTAPECTFTAPANKVFDKWQFSKDDSYLKPGDTKTIWSSADGATLTAIWKDAPVTEYDITVTDGKATVGAGTEISKAAQGTTVTLTAGAAPTGKVFDKWEVVSGGITLADVNSATTTFTMPASAVSVKATYKNAPHTHTYNQETVKPEALKTPADCTRNAVYFKSCSCGAISTTDTFVAMNTALGHAYGSDWKYDSTNHWHECSRCHDKKYEAAHSASEWIIDTAATETAKGAKHKECTVCKKVLETATIPATGSTHTHSYGVYVTPATTSKDGKIVKKCSACKNVASKKTIYKASKISISNKTYTYDGKAKKPTVTVKDSKGKKLSKGKDYTVSYSSGRKNVGRYAVKIKLKGNYSGTVTKTFDIVPKGTSIKKISASKKGFKVYWKAQKKNTTGYEIQYSTAKSFKNAKTVKVSKNSATSQSVAKLSGKKKYFVRVRTYKTVKYNGKKCKVHSSWSKPKTVVTKK